jgi:hypothetical protein
LKRFCAHTYTVWQSTLQRVSKSTEVDGIEKGVCVLLQGLRIILIAHWLTNTWVGIEKYVLAKLAVLLAILLLLFIVPLDNLWVAVVVSFVPGYLLFELYTVHFQIMFLSKLKFVAPPKSVERSLLLFIFNAAELLIAFAIFYRGGFGLRVGEAITNAILVFGTIGYRNDTGPIVAVQILLNFLLLAIFLATLIGRVGPFEKRQGRRR